MSDVKFSKAHTLGLEKARALAKKWAEDSAQKMGLNCQHVEGAEKDTITFERMGVSGLMSVTGTQLEVEVKLGLMMKAFKPMIESEISKNLTHIIEKASRKA